MAYLKGWGARLSSLCRILSGILASLRVEVLSITHVLQHTAHSQSRHSELRVGWCLTHKAVVWISRSAGRRWHRFRNEICRGC